MQLAHWKIMIIVQSMYVLAGSLCLVAGVVWLTNQSASLMGPALLAAGVFQVVFAFLLPGHRAFRSEPQMADFLIRFFSVLAVLALLAAVGFNWAVLYLF